jgi:hypothetical protein
MNGFALTLVSVIEIFQQLGNIASKEYPVTLCGHYKYFSPPLFASSR